VGLAGRADFVSLTVFGSLPRSPTVVRELGKPFAAVTSRATTLGGAGCALLGVTYGACSRYRPLLLPALIVMLATAWWAGYAAQSL